MEEVEGEELAGRQMRARQLEEEEEGEAGGDDGEEEGAGDLPWWVEVEEAGHPEFLVWMEAEEEELRRGLWTEEGEEGLPDRLWTGEEEVVGQSCEGAEEEEGDRHEKEVEAVPASSARS